MVDVGGDDRPAAGDLVAHEFRGDVVGQAGAPRLAVIARFETGGFIAQHGAAEVLALGHIFHLRRDDAAAGIVHLADVHAGFRAQDLLRDIGEGRDAAGAVGAKLAVVFRLHFAGGIFLNIAAGHDPFAALLFEPGANIDGGGRIGIGAGGIVDADAGFAAFEVDFPHGDAHAAAALRADMDLAAATDRAGGDADVEFAVDVGHALALLEAEKERNSVAAPLPPPMLIGSGSTGRRA